MAGLLSASQPRRVSAMTDHHLASKIQPRRVQAAALVGVITAIVGSADLARAATPALSGVWLRVDSNQELRADGKEGLPFTPRGLAEYTRIKADLKSGKLQDLTTELCLPEGMPRALLGPYPMQIITTPGQITFAHEANRAFRTVQLTKAHADPAIWDPSYMGDGIGTWQGDTLKIDSTNFKSDQIYLDATGLPASPRLHVVENIRLTQNGQQLEDVVTIDDPDTFTRPWTSRQVFVRRPDIDLRTDWVCGEPHRDLSQLKVSTPPTKLDPTAPGLSEAQLAFNGFWKGARGPGGAQPGPPPGPPGGDPAYGAPGGPGAQGAPGGPGGPGPRRGPPQDGVGSTARRYQLDWALAFTDSFRKAEASGEQQRTPNNLCLPSAVPGTGVPGGGAYGIALLVEPGQVSFLYEENRTIRIVYMDRTARDARTQSWLGHSTGHWEGDVLVIDTVGFNDMNMLTEGVPMTAKMQVNQRLRIVDGKLVDEARFTDPGAFTAPFSVTSRFERSQPFQEYICAENNHEGGVPTAHGVPTQAAFKVPLTQTQPKTN